jgi:putative tricarboxylic transport membrane protein
MRRRDGADNRREQEMRQLARLMRYMLVGLLFPASGALAADYPSRNVELVVAGSAGGGLDLVARQLDASLHESKLFNRAFVLKNIGGGGGNLAKNYAYQRKGEPHLLYLDSNRVVVNRIVGTTKISYSDVTPVARVMTEYLVWAVRADSAFKTARDILDRAKADPSSVTFGVGTIPGNDQMNILRAAMAVGMDAKSVKVLAFKSSRDATTQLLGGHAPVVSSGLSELLPHAQGGKVRLVAISAPEPLSGELASVPTWRSMGIDIAILHWRGLFGAPGHAPGGDKVLGADDRASHEDRRMEARTRAPQVVRRLRGLGELPARSRRGGQALQAGAHAARDGQGARAEVGVAVMTRPGRWPRPMIYSSGPRGHLWRTIFRSALPS